MAKLLYILGIGYIFFCRFGQGQSRGGRWRGSWRGTQRGTQRGRGRWRGRGRGRGRGGWSKEPVPTAEQLDADLDAYKEVSSRELVLLLDVLLLYFQS